MALSFTPSIDIIIGPMYSSKSTELIRRLVIYHDMGLKVLYINSYLDDRSQNDFSTHNQTISSIPFDSLKSRDLNVDVSKYDVIGIDEAQFFKGLAEQVKSWVEVSRKIVIMAGLNGDYQRKAFGEILDLIPYCDTLTKLSAFCMRCKREKNKITTAQFTQRIVSSDETVLIGGKESYQPVCRDCFQL